MPECLGEREQCFYFETKAEALPISLIKRSFDYKPSQDDRKRKAYSRSGVVSADGFNPWRQIFDRCSCQERRLSDIYLCDLRNVLTCKQKNPELIARMI
jgi:hypothetical protein